MKYKILKSEDFFSMGVDFEREEEHTQALLDELEVKSILVRFKLWEMDSLVNLKQFLIKNSDKKVILKILQDRENIEDLELLKTNLTTLFKELETHVDIFEIASTINRSKWGFFSVDEYNRFYQVAFDLKTTMFQNIKLIGSGVIDFEYHSFLTLFGDIKPTFLMCV